MTQAMGADVPGASQWLMNHHNVKIGPIEQAPRTTRSDAREIVPTFADISMAQIRQATLSSKAAG